MDLPSLAETWAAVLWTWGVDRGLLMGWLTAILLIPVSFALGPGPGVSSGCWPFSSPLGLASRSEAGSGGGDGSWKSGSSTRAPGRPGP